jgi:uncharacterized protein YbjT (DUF2867 family)
MPNDRKPAPIAVVAGATGLVGQALVRQLAADGGWREVRVLVRRALPAESGAPNVIPVRIDYADLDATPDWARGVDHLFCALGTTIRQAGSQAAFRQVDFEYALAFAKAGLAHGARHFLLVSALGADAESRVFYNRVKGELERAVSALGFRSVTIARPSLLLGERAERRIGEQLGKLVGVLAPGRWRPVPATQVAAALVAAAKRDTPGKEILDNRQLRATTLPRTKDTPGPPSSRPAARR